MAGDFVWHELMTTDTASAAKFFAGVVGWKTQPSAQEQTYQMFMAGKRQVAGLMVLPDDARAMGAPPSWLCYVGTPDVDATVKLAGELGGAVLRAPADIPTVGRFAVLRDPQGAVFAVFTPAAGSSMSGGPGPSDFSWHELATTDPAGALAFYRKLFGWKDAGAMEMGGPAGTYHMFGMGGPAVGGVFKKPATMPGPACWLPYIRVADSKQAAGKASKLGGKVINGPMEVPGGDWIAQGLDPQGAMFAVHSAKPAVAERAAAPPAQAKKRAARTVAPKKAGAKKAAKASLKKGAAKKAAPRPAAKRATKRPGGRKAARTSGGKTSRRVASRAARTRTARRRTTGRTARGSKKR